MKCGIGHLAYRTQDMPATLAFYVGKLGFSHAFSLADQDGNPWIEYLMAGDGRFIEFFYAGADFVPGNAYMHLCLEVEDCAAAVAELEAAGVEIMRPVSMGSDGNYQAWVKDPDGREIELMQLSPDSPQAKARKGI